MPLSYAAILGGAITVLGTSTNLVVSGLLDAGGAERRRVRDHTGGLPSPGAALVLVLIVPVLLPERRPRRRPRPTREFTVELIVTAKGPLVGRSVTEAGLRNSTASTWSRSCATTHHRPRAPRQTLKAGDRLVFAGAVDRVVDLQGVQGLVMAEEHHFGADGYIGHQFYEAVVAESASSTAPPSRRPTSGPLRRSGHGRAPGRTPAGRQAGRPPAPQVTSC